MITIKHECQDCYGTGLFSGMAEQNGAAFVCWRCKGEGFRETTFTQFSGRKSPYGVKRVFQTNPGISIGENATVKLEDFGGMPVGDWLNGKPFPPGSGMRSFTCPRWWHQCSGEYEVKWQECDNALGRRFSDCKHFCNKGECWKRLDAERAAK